MKNLGSLLKLDFRLVKPYWKWWLMFFGIALFMGIINSQGEVFIISFTIFAGTMTAFPFECTDKSNLNVLFATLPTNRKSMIVARFIFILILLVSSLIISIVIGTLINLGFSNQLSFNVTLLFVCISIGLFLLSVGFQTPFFYKYGYTKGRIFMWIPIVLVMIIFFLPTLFEIFSLDINFDVFALALRHMTATNLIAIGVGLVSLIISFYLSLKIYLKRDM